MTEAMERIHIGDLIKAAIAELPIRDEQHAREFLNIYPIDDQCALITAARIGKDHYGQNKLRDDPEDPAAYFPPTDPFSRFHTTGKYPDWIIQPEKHAEYFFLLSDSLPEYYGTFWHCADNSGYDLTNF